MSATREDRGETQRSWSWLPLLLLALAAVIFMTSTIPAIKEERQLDRLHDRLRRAVEKNDRVLDDLDRQVYSLEHDPQTIWSFLHRDRRDRVSGPGPSPDHASPDHE